METYLFTPAELAVLTQYLSAGQLVLDQVAQSDLGIDAEQLSLAEENLQERGLLVQAPQEQAIGVAGDIGTLLMTTLAPDILCVVRTQRREGAEPVMYWSFTPECIARNYINAEGQHVFTELASLDEAVDAMLPAGEAQPSQAPHPGGGAEPLEALVPDSEALTMFMVVVNPAQPQPQVQNLSWLVARNGLWLVDASVQQATARGRRTNLLELRQVLLNTLASASSLISS
jgi:hypothetical protein